QQWRACQQQGRELRELPAGNLATCGPADERLHVVFLHIVCHFSSPCCWSRFDTRRYRASRIPLSAGHVSQTGLPGPEIPAATSLGTATLSLVPCLVERSSFVIEPR